MKSNLVRFLLTLALTCMAHSSISASVEEAEEFISKLKTHYQETLPIHAFSLKLHFLNKRYRSYDYWDYKTPNRHMSQRIVEMDLEKRHFFDNDILYYSGDRIFNRVQFQNDQESIFYEKSATVFGKTIVKRGMDRFDSFKRHIVFNIDFLAVRPLLEENNIKEKIRLHQDKKLETTTLTYTLSDESDVIYQFSNKPLQLRSIHNKSMRGIFIYDDYRTTRGITYARSVNKYYDDAVNQYFEGKTEPTYMSFNDDFNLIKEVDPAKLQVPAGYGPEYTRGDGVLISDEIAEGLHLVTDSSSVTNSLFKVNGDRITVFGASNNSTWAAKVVKLIQNQFPAKKIDTVYVTHPHANQIAGLKVFVEQGAEILADEYTIEGIKAYPRFADDISKFKFKTIENKKIVDGTHFYVLENMHAKRQSFAHFENSGIIFQSHFLHIPYDNTIAKVIPSYTRTFIDFVRSNKLKVNRIVANNRNNNISLEVMNRTYEAHTQG